MGQQFSGTLKSMLLPAHGVHDGARIVECSPDLAAMFGYTTPQMILGRNLLDFIDPAYHDQSAQQVLSADQELAYPSVGVKANGARFRVEASARLVRYQDKQARLILVRDLSPIALVVDDDCVIANMVCQLLGRLGYRTLAVDSGSAALAEFSAGQLALVTTDIVMPGMNGRELGERMRSLDATQPILYMSGFNEERIDFDAHSHFIGKPFGMAELKRAVEELPPRAREGLIT